MPQNDVPLRELACRAMLEREPSPLNWMHPKQAWMLGLRVGMEIQISGHRASVISVAKAKFDALADEWHRATHLHSSIALKSMHPAYQKIIGMGKDALPLIFERLRTGSGHWFWALTSITGEMPIPKEDLGRMAKMREHWLSWGQRNGYLESTR